MNWLKKIIFGKRKDTYTSKEIEQMRLDLLKADFRSKMLLESKKYAKIEHLLIHDCWVVRYTGQRYSNRHFLHYYSFSGYTCFYRGLTSESKFPTYDEATHALCLYHESTTYKT